MEPQAVDNIGLTVSVETDFTPGHCFPLGMTTVIYTFRDPSGNSAICRFVVNIMEPQVVGSCTLSYFWRKKQCSFDYEKLTKVMKNLKQMNEKTETMNFNYHAWKSLAASQKIKKSQKSCKILI